MILRDEIRVLNALTQWPLSLEMFKFNVQSFNTSVEVEKKQERGEEQELQFREALESFGPDSVFLSGSRRPGSLSAYNSRESMIGFSSRMRSTTHNYCQ